MNAVNVTKYSTLANDTLCMLFTVGLYRSSVHYKSLNCIHFQLLNSAIYILFFVKDICVCLRSHVRELASGPPAIQETAKAHKQMKAIYNLRYA